MTLSELADRVESGEATSEDVFNQFGTDENGVNSDWMSWNEALTSIDAAVKLLEEVLETRTWRVERLPRYNDDKSIFEDGCCAIVWSNRQRFVSEAPTPAAALVAAILRAKEEPSE